MSETKLAWTMIYASILGIAHHPRQTENGGKPSMTPQQAAAATDAAMAPWIERWGENGVGGAQDGGR